MSADGDWKDIFPIASRKEAQDLVMNMMEILGEQMHGTEARVYTEVMDADDPEPAQSLQWML